MAVYDVSRPTRPVFRQVLPTTNGPEGILPVPARNLLVVSSEVDDAEAGVRATVGLYRLGARGPSFPGIVSTKESGPIGWGALSGLSADPASRHRLWSVTDAAFVPTRLLHLTTGAAPARIFGELTVTDAAGEPVGVDAEGVFARPGGGFWLAVEGTADAPGDNRLLRLDGRGRILRTVPLPADVVAGLRAQGLEGVTATRDRRGREQVWVVVQRELTTDPAGVTRIGRYDVDSGRWAWWGYRLETTDTPGDFVGLSEITAIGGRLAVIERDSLNGPDARIKRVYTVRHPSGTPAAGTLPVLPKRLLVDVLPALRSTRGWTQEKLEGLTVGGDGRLYAVTDNDALDDATGETVFLRSDRGEANLRVVRPAKPAR